MVTKLKEEKIKKAYHRRGIGTGVRLLAKPPLCGELAVCNVVHHMGHFVVRHVLGAHPTRIELAAHLTDQMRAALKRKHPARDEGGQQVGPSQALRLDHYPESGDGHGSSLRQRHGPIAPLGLPPSWRAGYVSRQIDVVALWCDVLHIEV